MTKRKFDVEESSGNIYKDLGYKNYNEMQLKADLACEIAAIIKNKKLTQAQAAKIMGVDQPKVSAIVNGRFSSISLDKMFRFLLLLGQDIEIRISNHKSKGDPHIRIAA